MLVEVLLAESFQFHGTLLERQAFLVGVLGDFGGHVVTNDWVQAGHKHETVAVRNELFVVKQATYLS